MSKEYKPSNVVRKMQKAHDDREDDIEFILKVKRTLLSHGKKAKDLIEDDLDRAIEIGPTVWKDLTSPLWDHFRNNYGVASEAFGNLLECDVPKIPQQLDEHRIRKFITGLQNSLVYGQGQLEIFKGLVEYLDAAMQRAQDIWVTLSFSEAVTEQKSQFSLLLPIDIDEIHRTLSATEKQWRIRCDTIESSYKHLSRILTAHEIEIETSGLGYRKEKHRSETPRSGSMSILDID